MVINLLKKNSLFIFFGLFLLYLFLVFDTDFHGPDQPIYFAYTASVIEDGDLNAVNHLDETYSYYLPSGKIGVSKTYNLPDFHNHGGVIFWMPFYAYAKSIYYIAKKLALIGITTYDFKKVAQCIMSFSTIVFAFFATLLTYMLTRVFFSHKTALVSTLAIFFGTPFFYYTITEVGNGNMVACLFAIFLIWFGSYTINSMKGFHWFLYGIFFSIAVAVKLDLWFQIVFIAGLFIVFLLRKQTKIKNGLYFILGLMPGLMLKHINDYIKYGTFHIGEASLFNFKDSYLFEQLFSSYHGFFYTSPIFYLCTLGLLIVIKNLSKNFKDLYNFRTANSVSPKLTSDLFLFLLGAYAVFKILIISRRYAWGGGTCGARPLLTEFPVFVLLYARLLQEKKQPLISFFITICALMFIGWNFLVISEYLGGVDLKYVTGALPIGKRIASLGNIMTLLLHIKDLHLKLKVLLPLFVGMYVVLYHVIITVKIPRPSFWYIRSQEHNKFFEKFAVFVVYLFIMYNAVTLLNITNNSRNVERLTQEGFFENVSILTPLEFEKQENLGSMNEMIEYFTLQRDFGRADKIRLIKEEMYGDTE